MSGRTDTNLGFVVSKDFLKWVSFEVRYEGQDRQRHAYIRKRTSHTNKLADKGSLKLKKKVAIFWK